MLNRSTLWRANVPARGVVVSCMLALAACGSSASGTSAPPSPAPTAAPVIITVAPPATATRITPTDTPRSTTAPPSQSTPGVTVSPAAIPTRGGGPSNDAASARLAIGIAANKWFNNGPMKMHITSTEPGSNPADMWIVPPDSSRFVQTLSDGSRFETIRIATANYSFVNSSWKATASEAIPLDLPLWTDPAALNDIQNIQALGNRTINGVNAAGYSFTDVSAPGELNTMWIGPAGAPVQVISISEGETTTYDIVYDASIKIAAPIK